MKIVSNHINKFVIPNHITMTDCFHKNLVLIKKDSNKLRCRDCHLTISVDELNDSFCPECYETTGKKHTNFEKIEAGIQEISQYRCEDCGAIIKTEG